MPVLGLPRPLSVLDLGPIYAANRQTDVSQTDRETDDRQMSDDRQKHRAY